MDPNNCLPAAENKHSPPKSLADAACLFPMESGTFLVGGCVRDLLIGRQPSDYDLAVSGDPAKYAQKIAGKHGGRPVPIGPPAHRIFRITAGQRIFDVSPLQGMSIDADLKNRDFTINAMAFDIAGQTLIDPENGLSDLHDRCLKAVSEESFTNDPLRLLRAFRLKAQFDCKIDPATFRAIRTDATLIRDCAGERVRAELLKLFSSFNAFDALWQMADCRLLFNIIPELKPLEKCRQNTHHSFDVWTHTLAAFRELEILLAQAPSPSGDSMALKAASQVADRRKTGLLKTAILLHDIGKPATRTIDENGRIHFYGHGRRGCKIAMDICRRIKFSRHETDYIGKVIKNHNRPLFIFLLQGKNQLSRKAVTRFFIQCRDAAPDILLHAAADFAGKRPSPSKESKAFAEFAETLLERYFSIHLQRQSKPALINGRDLITGFGLAPSPIFKKILATVKAAQLAGEISKKQEAMALVSRLLDRDGSCGT